MRHAIVIVLAALLPVTVLAEGKPQREPLKVFVTNDGPRPDSIQDLRKALGKKKTLMLVEAAEGADVIVSITDAGTVRGGAGMRLPSLGAHAVAGSVSNTFEGGGVTIYWKDAAGMIAKGIDKWIQKEYDQLITQRQKKNQP